MLAALAGTEMQAQTLQSAPRLVVNITIDRCAPATLSTSPHFMVRKVSANCCNMVVSTKLPATLSRPSIAHQQWLQ